MNSTYPVQADGKLMSNVYIFLGWSWSLSSIRRNFPGMSCYFFSFVDNISRQYNHAQISTKFKQFLLQLTLFISLLNLQATRHDCEVGLYSYLVFYRLTLNNCCIAHVCLLCEASACEILRQEKIKVRISDPVENFVLNGLLFFFLILLSSNKSLYRIQVKCSQYRNHVFCITAETQNILIDV